MFQNFITISVTSAKQLMSFIQTAYESLNGLGDRFNVHVQIVKVIWWVMRGRETSHVLSQGAESLLISPLVIVRAVNWSNVFNFCRIVVLTYFSNFLTTSSDDALHQACQQLRNKYYCDISAEFPSQIRCCLLGHTFVKLAQNVNRSRSSLTPCLGFLLWWRLFGISAFWQLLSQLHNENALSQNWKL